MSDADLGTTEAVSRASYVYVVSDPLGPVAGFTVKYELAFWLRRNVKPELVLTVTRLPDGRDGRIANLDIEELMREN
jgi:hypothetical protein